MSAVRQPPPYSNHPKGTCRLCGKAILKDDGSPDTRKNWHRACVWDWKIATSSASARDALLTRDGGRCADCGIVCYRAEPGPKWAPTYPADYVFVGAVRVEHWCTRVNWVEVRAWHGDHDIPLWSVDKSAPGALRYWMLDNLVTRCEPCHKEKSAAETTQRAKEKRIRDKAAGVVKLKRKIPSRGFPKAHRPLRRKA